MERVDEFSLPERCACNGPGCPTCNPEKYLFYDILQDETQDGKPEHP